MQLPEPSQRAWRKIIILSAAALLSGGAATEAMAQKRAPAATQQLGADFKAETIKAADGTTQPFAVFVPEKYDPKTAWPLVVFLHGSGESGTDGYLQTKVGLGPFIERYRKFCPFIAVFPQSPNMKTWFRGAQAKTVFEIIDKVRAEYNVDPDRIYLTGVSMGGFGTWELAMMRPDLFAAIIPICGGGPVELVGSLKDMPIWCFHGARDDRVPVEYSRKLINRLKQLGAEPKYTEYPMLGHVCWDEVYTTKGLFPWMLKQRRRAAPNAIAAELDRTWCPIPTTMYWLRIDAAEAKAKLLRLAARIDSPTLVQVVSAGVTGITVMLKEPPKKEEPVTVLWQGQMAYRGAWKPEITIATTSQPTTGIKNGGSPNANSE